MIYDIAEVQDRGSYYSVLNVLKSSFDKQTSNKYLKLSHSAYKIIYDALLQNKSVKILKNLSVDEVLPGEVRISDEDDFTLLKHNAYLKIKMLVTPEMTKESGFTLYNFIMKNNALCSKGYFICDENREDKYIEIIETGDEDLISLLEEFLESKDKMERASSIYDKLQKVKIKLDECKTKDEVQSIQEQFLSDFYSNF